MVSKTNINNQNLDLSLLESLSPEEKELALAILEEYSKEGTSEQLNKLLLEDYNEIPVDILTFVDNYEYLGNAWHDSEGKSKLYPYWREELVKIFPDNLTTSINNAILSGSRGRGKTEIAVLIAAYLLHRVLCLKDPIAYFHLKPTEKLVFAFMNIKKDLAEEIGIAKFQNTIQSSPWFLKHGTIEGRTNKVWVPQKFNNQEAVDIKIGSQADDLIGLPIYFCLEGNTEILTTNGTFKIEDLLDKKIKVPTLSDDHKFIISDECTVKQTAESSIEYEIELEDGSIIKCTPTHRFRLVDGSYKEAQKLTEADEILDFIPYGYVYKTTNLINGKIYIGQHKKAFLDSNYLGSGFALNKAVKKYGINNFKCEILQLYASKNDLNNGEKEYIKKFNSNDSTIGYNIADGGQGGDLGEVSRARISAALKGRPKTAGHRKKLSDINRGKRLSPDTKAKISVGNRGKILSDETKTKMSSSAKKLNHSGYQTLKDKIAINNGELVKFIDKSLEIPNGWEKGNITARKAHNMTNYYNDKDAMLRKSEAHKGCKNSMYGKGYLRTGGNNTNATKYYIFNNIRFECRNDLVTYLKENGYPDISGSAIRNIENKGYSKRTIKKFKYIIENLIWGYKNEN